MSLRHMRKTVQVLSLSLLLAASSGASAALIKSYDFNGDLTDTLGNGVDLIASGGSVAGGVYSFTNNQGLRLDNALADTNVYGVEIGLTITDSTNGFNKIIDFQNLASDLGLYVLNGSIDFFTSGPSLGSVSVNNFFTLGLERQLSGLMNVFLDGSLLFSAASGGQAVSVPNILNFFEDDFATGQGESFAGTADFIRIHNDASSFGSSPVPTPEPATLALFAAGLAGLGFGRRKQ